jgi:hypothetical protein
MFISRKKIEEECSNSYDRGFDSGMIEVKEVAQQRNTALETIAAMTTILKVGGCSLSEIITKVATESKSARKEGEDIGKEAGELQLKSDALLAKADKFDKAIAALGIVAKL